VTPANRALLLRAGYSDGEVDGLTDRLARLILRDFQRAGVGRRSYEPLYEKEESGDAA
jgi:hypothetical protein